MLLVPRHAAILLLRVCEAAQERWLARKPCSSSYLFVTREVFLRRIMEAPFMDADKPSRSVDLTQHKLAKARALWTLEEADRIAKDEAPSPANLDREPAPPHAPEASPVEARVRRFAGARDLTL